MLLGLKLRIKFPSKTSSSHEFVSGWQQFVPLSYDNAPRFVGVVVWRHISERATVESDKEALINSVLTRASIRANSLDYGVRRNDTLDSIEVYLTTCLS